MSCSIKVFNNFDRMEKDRTGKNIPIYRKHTVYLNKEQAEIEKQSRDIQREMINAKTRSRRNLQGSR